MLTDSAVILAGGLATRMRPFTEKIPKALLEVAGKPFIDQQLALLKRHQFRHVVLCLGYLGEQIEEHVKERDFGLEVAFSYDGPNLLGTGGALLQARPLLDKVFWVLYGDSYLDFDYQAAARSFEEPYRAGKAGLMTVFNNGNRWDSSNVIFKEGQLIRYDKFNRTEEMRYIDYGASILTERALDRLGGSAEPGRAYELSNLYTELVADGLMPGYEVTRRFYEIGSPDGLQQTHNYLTGEGGKNDF